MAGQPLRPGSLTEPIELAPIRRDEPGQAKPKISLQQAARDDKYEVVKEWMEWYEQHPIMDRRGRKKSNPVDEKDPDGLTALHYAARFNRFKILQYLLTERPDVNVKTELGFTPLHYSAKYLPRIIDENEASESDATSVEVTRKSSSARSIAFLLQSNANPNIQDADGLTPLAIACQRGNFFAVDRLLRADGIDIAICDNQGSTPLHEACEFGSEKIVELLLKKGAQILEADRDGVTSLHVACREGHVAIVKQLFLHGYHMKEGLVKAEDIHGSSALHFAVESGVKDIVEVLLLNGADPIAQKKNEVTPLHIAARNGHIGIAKYILQYKGQSQGGFDIIEMIEREQNTPLHFAAHFNQCEMIEYLVSEGANLEALDEKSFTPLLTAVAWSRKEAVECLLKLGAEVDATDKDGSSSVFWATKQDCVEILKAFINHGNDGRELSQGTDSFNNHLLHIACKYGNQSTLKYLLSLDNPKLKTACRNEISQTPLHLTAQHGHVQSMKELTFVNKELIPLVDDEGNSALHMACIEGYVNVAKVLIEQGAAVDVRNDKQWTPMDCAAHNGHEKLIKLLIDCDAPIDAKDRSLETPLTLACREGHLSCVKVLVDGGADVKQKSQNGFNCLDLAIEHGHEEIAKYLVECKQWRNALRNCVENFNTPMRRLIRKMPDIAVHVFNKCTSDNVGATMELPHGGEVTVTQDGPHFEVTFDYEFLEDFQEEKAQSIQIRQEDGKSYDFRSESGYSGSDDVAESSDGIHLFQSAAIRQVLGAHDTWENEWGPIRFKKSNHPLNIMVESERITLLSHPLVTSLLRSKWQRYGRWLYWLNLSTFFAFLAFLTLYAILLPPPNTGQCNGEAERCDGPIFNGTISDGSTRVGVIQNSSIMVNGSLVNGSIVNGTVVVDGDMMTIGVVTNFTRTRVDCDCDESRCSDDFTNERRSFLRFAAAVVLLFSTIRLFIESIQLVSDHISYITDWENWIEVCLFISSILFASGGYIQCCVCVKNWQWQLGAAAIFLAWFDLVLFMKKLPLFGVYVVMFIQIVYTFLRFMFLALLFIVAFGLSFYMLFVQLDEPDRDPFRNPGRSMLKTMVMTTGEFEFDTIFFATQLDFAAVSYVLWIVFVILMPILLTNLLVGLAVDDIKQVQEDAELKRLALQVELALSAERFISRWVGRRYVLSKFCKVLPNRKNSIWEYMQSFWGVERFDAPTRIARAIQPQQETEEVLLHQNRKLTEEVNHLKATVNEMSLLIHKMAEKQNIDLKDTRN